MVRRVPHNDSLASFRVGTTPLRLRLWPVLMWRARASPVLPCHWDVIYYTRRRRHSFRPLGVTTDSNPCQADPCLDKPRPIVRCTYRHQLAKDVLASPLQTPCILGKSPGIQPLEIQSGKTFERLMAHSLDGISAHAPIIGAGGVLHRHNIAHPSFEISPNVSSLGGLRLGSSRYRVASAHCLASRFVSNVWVISCRCPSRHTAPPGLSSGRSRVSGVRRHKDL